MESLSTGCYGQLQPNKYSQPVVDQGENKQDESFSCALHSDDKLEVKESLWHFEIETLF